MGRKYSKRRDWFDFIWYLSRNTNLNYDFLENALNQFGPWAGKNLSINKKWLLENFEEKIINKDWENAKKDVQRFLKDHELESLKFWDKEFFIEKLKKFENYL